jgi:hypothetical protein
VNPLSALAAVVAEVRQAFGAGVALVAVVNLVSNVVISFA